MATTEGGYDDDSVLDDREKVVAMVTEDPAFNELRNEGAGGVEGRKPVGFEEVDVATSPEVPELPIGTLPGIDRLIAVGKLSSFQI